MTAAASELKQQLLRDLLAASDPELTAVHGSLSQELGRDVSIEEASDVLAQSAVSAAPILASSPDADRAASWLIESATQWQRWAIQAAVSLPLSVSSPLPVASAAHLYELFLHRHCHSTRKRHGVFFTPQPIADYIVAQIDRLLRDEFALSDGLTSHSAICNPQSAIQLLDPACGTGIFLLTVIDYIRSRLGNGWNEFIPDLLPRLSGIELLPAAAFLAKLNIAVKLAETGYDFRQPGSVNIHVGDALDPACHSAIRNSHSAIPVVLGNPPFSSLSTNTNPWIARLVRGDETVRGYAHAGDQRLGERKTWLHDDYVKFIRLAQWHVEVAGRGIVGFVTNHGYLDNTTFRLMRHELLRVFPQVEIVDLHGNRKKDETAPDGGCDENVFGLDQGVAIGIFARSAAEAALRVEYAELWGSREDKLASLVVSPSPARRISLLTPLPPRWRFVPTVSRTHPEYAMAWPLPKAMPVNTTAPVTARDHFVVAFTQEELCRRIEEFRDLSIPDDEIRSRHFNRTRCSRYPPGDTRGWNLAQARRTVAADQHWRQHIRRCLYRPFDWRYVFWHPAMIDWPRNDITRHLLDPIENPKSKIQNLCLVTRRQQLPTQPCAFFWIADGLALDGVIRSDNRGSESLFPLYLRMVDGRPNFAPEFVAEVERQIGTIPLPEDLLGYIYALFYSPSYRERYAHELRSDFPRVLLPMSGRLFGELAVIGNRLTDLHLLRAGPAKDSRPVGDGFRVGGYVVLKKWLQPKHRSRSDAQYGAMVAAIAETIDLMTVIDESIARHGGFPAAFDSKPRPVVGVLGDSPSSELAP